MSNVQRRAIHWVVVPLLVALTGACGPKVDDPADVAAIKELVASYSTALSAGDADGVASGYSDDAMKMVPNQPVVTGREAIRSLVQSWIDQSAPQEQSIPEDVRVSGDLGVARGVYTAKPTRTIPGAAVAEEKGKWLAFYRRQADGGWKTVADIWNFDRPVAETLGPTGPDEQALLQVERDWMNAWRTMDVAAMDRILATEFVESFDGQVNTKAKVLANMKSGIYQVESAEARDMRVLVFGDHAVVNGTTTVKQTLRGKDDSGAGRWTDTFVKRDGRWQAVTSYAVKVQ